MPRLMPSQCRHRLSGCKVTYFSAHSLGSAKFLFPPPLVSDKNTNRIGSYNRSYWPGRPVV
jgi:hypothetical protein